MKILGKQTLFAVPLSCDGCVKSVSDSIYKLDGISKVEGNLTDQLISVEGSGELSHDGCALSMPLHKSIYHMLTHRAMPQSHHLPSSRLFRPRGEMPSSGGPALQTVSFMAMAAGLSARAVLACYDSGPLFFLERLVY